MSSAVRIRLLALAMMGLTTMAELVAASESDVFLGQLGLGCKNRVLEEFGVPNSDIMVRLGATVRGSLESGEMTLKDLKAYGASFDWSLASQDIRGYCNVDGQGKVTEFEQW